MNLVYFRGRRGYFSAKVDEKSKIKTKFCSEMHFNTEYLQQSGQGELQQLREAFQIKKYAQI